MSNQNTLASFYRQAKQRHWYVIVILIFLLQGTTVEEEFTKAKGKFFRLAELVKMPNFDVQFYKLTYMNTCSEENLYNVAIVIDALEEHKNRTVQVLACIVERERVFAKLKKQCNILKTGKKK